MRTLRLELRRIVALHMRNARERSKLLLCTLESRHIGVARPMALSVRVGTSPLGVWLDYLILAVSSPTTSTLQAPSSV